MKTNNFKKLKISGLKIAIVQARFNPKITNSLTKGSLKALTEAGMQKKDIKIFKVPGAFEIPLICKKLAKIKKFNGIVALGAVIKGETAHFEYVSKGAQEGIMQVMLDNEIPISFGVLATYDLAQAQKRAQDDKNNKGYEAAMALIELISLMTNVK